ncbi:MAG: TetR/AcrR family transcriptional regulator [Bacteroidota bacterium]
MAASVQINVNENLYLRDPQSTKLGKKIIKEGIFLINDLGLESFTFKKLAGRIESTEASIYRYFTNKHIFLVYLVSYYWEWVRFRIDFNCMNVEDPVRKLKIVVKTIVDTVRLANPAEYIDRDELHHLVIFEGSKAYHVKEVDEENKQGFFRTLKALNAKIAGIILDINPSFPYPKAAASDLLEMANNHHYYAAHLPSLTDIVIRDENMEELEKLMEYFIFRLIGQ